MSAAHWPRPSTDRESGTILRRHAGIILYLTGLFGWVTAIPLYGPFGIAWATMHHLSFTPLVDAFLGGGVVGSILMGYLADRRPGRTRGLGLASVVGCGILTVLLLLIGPTLAMPLYAAAGVAAAGPVVWGRWFATTVRPLQIGRVFALAATGVALMHWAFDLLAQVVSPVVGVALSLLPLALAVVALCLVDDTPVRTHYPATLVSARVKVRVLVRFGLFIVLFSLVAGLSYQALVALPVSSSASEALRRAPYIVGVLIAGGMADRRNLQAVMALGAALLALAFLLVAWSANPAIALISVLLNGMAFGLLEGAPWLLLAGHATKETAGRWFGWGLNLNIIPILIGALVYRPLGLLSPVHLALAAAVVLVLAALSLTGVSDPLTILHSYAGMEAGPGSAVPPGAGDAMDKTDPAPDAASASQPRPAQPPLTQISVVDLLEQRYGETLTPRELEIGQLAVLGISTDDIARQVYISTNTVRTHLKNVYRKTDTSNRNHLYRKLVSGDNSPVAR